MEKEVIVKNKSNKEYKLVLKIDIDKDDGELLKKGYNLLVLGQKLSEKQNEILETVFGYYWYKKCKIEILK